MAIIALTHRMAVFAAICLISLPSQLHAFNTYDIGSPVIGQEYNEVLGKWLDKSFTISVGIDEQGTTRIIFQSDSGLGRVVVVDTYSQAEIERFRGLLATALEWKEVAQKNKADTDTALGCFPQSKQSLCEKEGRAFYGNEMGLRFYSAKGGKQSDLIITLIDQSNSLMQATVYLDEKAIRKLIKNTNDFSVALKLAEDSATQKSLFQKPESLQQNNHGGKTEESRLKSRSLPLTPGPKNRPSLADELNKELDYELNRLRAK